MQILSVIFALSSLFAVTFGALSIQQNATHPDHPGKCFDPSSNLVLGPEEMKSIPGSCARISCTEDFSLTHASCGLFGPGPNCEKIEQDLSKDYPECCIKYKCEQDGEVSYH